VRRDVAVWNYKPCKITQCYKDDNGIIEVFCSDGYLKLKGAGRIVWIMSDGENTVSDIVDVVSQNNGGSDKNDVYNKVVSLIHGLAEKHLIIPDWDPLYKKSNILKSNDMQELDVLLILAPSPQPGLTIGNKVQGMPPLGLGYIGTYLKNNNYKAKILDFNLEYVIDEALKAPLTMDTIIGRAILSKDGHVLGEFKLYPETNIEKENLFKFFINNYLKTTIR